MPVCLQYNPSAGSDSDAGKRRSGRAPARGSRVSARSRRRQSSEEEESESASEDDFSDVSIVLYIRKTSGQLVLLNVYYLELYTIFKQIVLKNGSLKVLTFGNTKPCG